MFKREIDLTHILQGCRQGQRNSQRQLYEHFYGYAMNVCLRYSKNREQAVEILNDVFLKVFTRLDQYDPAYPFKAWLRRILVNSAIDYFRKNNSLPVHLDISAAIGLADDDFPLPQLSDNEDVLPILQHLSPAYRLVFNLYVMEEYSHQEIATMLGIDVRTSRSNLMRAKEKIRTLMLQKTFKPVSLN